MSVVKANPKKIYNFENIDELTGFIAFNFGKLGIDHNEVQYFINALIFHFATRDSPKVEKFSMHKSFRNNGLFNCKTSDMLTEDLYFYDISIEDIHDKIKYIRTVS